MADSLHLVEFAPVHLHVKVKSNSLCMAEFLSCGGSLGICTPYFYGITDLKIVQCYAAIPNREGGE